MKSMKKHIALFFITLILLLKVADFHVLTHDADTTDAQHCEVCLVETVVNLTPLIEAESPALPERVYYFSERELINTATYVVISNSYLASYHSTRPPPQIL